MVLTATVEEITNNNNSLRFFNEPINRCTSQGCAFPITCKYPLSAVTLWKVCRVEECSLLNYSEVVQIISSLLVYGILIGRLGFEYLIEIRSSKVNSTKYISRNGRQIRCQWIKE